MGGFHRSFEKVRKKWQDTKSSAVTKNNKATRDQTGGGRAPRVTSNKWEKQVIDMLIQKKSNLIHGLNDGFDTGVHTSLLLHLKCKVVFEEQ